MIIIYELAVVGAVALIAVASGIAWALLTDRPEEDCEICEACDGLCFRRPSRSQSLTTAKPGKRGHCLVHDEDMPLQACTCNPRPAVTTAAPQAEAHAHSLTLTDLATQRDELADALDNLLAEAEGQGGTYGFTRDAARAALKKAGRR